MDTPYFSDVHAHLTDERFANDLPEVIERARNNGLGSIIVNGLEPKSNRQVLKLAEEFDIIQPALGIYPVDAVAEFLPKDAPVRSHVFDIKAELEFIREQALNKKIIAVGECGLDGHWVEEDLFSEQEAVLEYLIGIAIEADIPLIVHSRKREKRTIEMMVAHGVKKVDFHCFGGRSKHAKEAAEKHNYYFSIPANSRKNQAFAKMLSVLPLENILTETDCPYLAPVRGERNEPANVLGTAEHLAELRQLSLEKTKHQLFQNYSNLFL